MNKEREDGLDCLGHFNVFSVLNCLCCLLPGGTVQEADQEQASASSKGRREGSHATASWVRSGPVRTAVSAGHRGVSEGRATELEEA